MREHLFEEIPERCGSRNAAAAREIEPLESERDRRRLADDAGGVVPCPPLRIAQCFVCARDLLEARFRCVVARVDVRVIFPRKPSVRPLDLDKRGPLGQSKQFVEIHFLWALGFRL